MEKGDLITYRGVEYVVTSLKNGVHAVLASTVDEAGTSGSSHYLGSIDEVEADWVSGPLDETAYGLIERPEIEGCESGEATGELCQSVLGPDAVVIEWMPEYLRESHRAAGNSGSYPGNGAIRFRACPECAASLAQHDGEWTRVVD